MKAKRFSKAQQPSVDIITTLPETITEKILCLLPIEEAARTSILSTEWRYKWTKIPKLVFSQSTFKRSTKKKRFSKRKRISDEGLARENMNARCKLFYAIHQVLLLHQGPIQEFTLLMNSNSTCFEIDQIILHLSMNQTLKKLTLDFKEPCEGFYCLPLSVFSLHHLTELYLANCEVNLKPNFNGFDLFSLTKLTLNKIRISGKALLHLLSNCPSLKSLSLTPEESVYDFKESYIMELFKCLPVIEHLTISNYLIPPNVVPSVLKELPLLIHLKYFCIKELTFYTDYILTFLGLLMKCSSNLEEIKLEIEVDDGSNELDFDQLKEFRVMLEEYYSDVWLEHLNELEIHHFRDDEIEFDFVKYILARSPNLKKVRLDTYVFNRNQKLKLRKTLLRIPRVSPVEIGFEIL